MPSFYTFLFIEFLNKNNLLTRLRYQINRWHFHFPRVQITERGQRFGFEGRKSRKAFIVIDSRVSENDLFEELRNYISEKHEVPKESISFRWETRSLKKEYKKHSLCNIKDYFLSGELFGVVLT